MVEKEQSAFKLNVPVATVITQVIHVKVNVPLTSVFTRVESAGKYISCTMQMRPFGDV